MQARIATGPARNFNHGAHPAKSGLAL